MPQRYGHETPLHPPRVGEGKLRGVDRPSLPEKEVDIEGTGTVPVTSTEAPQGSLDRQGLLEKFGGF
jgi:hypothetical protein